MNNSSDRQGAIGAVIVLFFLFAVTESPFFLFLMMIAIFAYAARNNERNRQLDYSDDRSTRRYRDREQRSDYRAPPEDSAQSPTADRVHTHALDAVRAAGLSPDTTAVLPVDIGLLSFSGIKDPVIHRTWPVDNDVDYLQPYLQLRVPVAARGRVKFEILDSAGQRIYAHEDVYQLRRGRNLIMPSTRLPVHDEQQAEGRWELRVSADGMTIARHQFEWRAADEPSAPPVTSEDGEISSEMRALLVDSRLQRMSLDDLLAHQEEDQAGRGSSR
jgi:hypothetical protein